MTQEVKLTVKEAIERLKGYPDDTEVIGLQISLLKEPKSAREKFIARMKAYNYGDASSGMKDALGAFDYAVEK